MKHLGGNIVGCNKDKKYSWDSVGFPNAITILIVP